MFVKLCEEEWQEIGAADFPDLVKYYKESIMNANSTFSSTQLQGLAEDFFFRIKYKQYQPKQYILAEEVLKVNELRELYLEAIISNLSKDNVRLLLDLESYIGIRLIFLKARECLKNGNNVPESLLIGYFAPSYKDKKGNLLVEIEDGDLEKLDQNILAEAKEYFAQQEVATL